MTRRTRHGDDDGDGDYDVNNDDNDDDAPRGHPPPREATHGRTG